MNPVWHRLFAAMPAGRDVTAHDVHNRAKPALPRGWGFRDTAQALQWMARREGVQRVDVTCGLTIYRRTA